MRSFVWILVFGLFANLPAAAKEPVVEAVVDWQHDKILLSAQWQAGEALSRQSIAELRQRMREALLQRLSLVVGKLWQRSQTTSAATPDFSALWSSLRLDTFQVAENRALATMQVSLKGRDSLLAHFPLDYGSELHADGDGSQALTYDKRPNLGEYDNSDSEPLLYTGLVIDARHLPYVPSLNTGVFTAGGRQLYGAAFLSRSTAVKRGVAGHFAADTVPAALRRAGRRPLKVSAIDLQSAGETGLVISEEDAARLLAHAGSVRNLRRARLIILVSSERLRERH